MQVRWTTTCHYLTAWNVGKTKTVLLASYLCIEKDCTEVELALEEIDKPIGVADYQLIVTLEELKKIVAEEVEAFG